MAKSFGEVNSFGWTMRLSNTLKLDRMEKSTTVTNHLAITLTIYRIMIIKCDANFNFKMLYLFLGLAIYLIDSVQI